MAQSSSLSRTRECAQDRTVEFEHTAVAQSGRGFEDIGAAGCRGRHAADRGDREEPGPGLQRPVGGRAQLDCVCAETASTRDCGAGSMAVWNGAKTQVQLVDTISAPPMSAVKSNAKLSISPTSIGSNEVTKRMAEFLIDL